MLPIIDTDSHVSEPADLWTSRLSAKKWGDRIPHVEFDERNGEDKWFINSKKVMGVATWASAGWPEYPPSHPKSFEEADSGAYDAVARLNRMDEYGITAQVLYPNLLTFAVHSFLGLKDPKLMLECVRAYNDFQVDFASPASDRFVLLTALPFWDVAASQAEIVRCHEKGHRGVLFMSKPQKFDLPSLADPHWQPIMKTAQDLGVSINFHVGYQDLTQEELRTIVGRGAERADHARESTLSMIGLAAGLADILTSGMCHVYPDLKFVLVESGFGWLPFFLETLDWQWINSGAKQEYPDREMPSYYFYRQVFATFWFERETVRAMGETMEDNLMFETDYPHATSLSPGPASSSEKPWRVAEQTLDGLPDSFVRKVLYENAARLYDVPIAKLAVI